MANPLEELRMIDERRNELLEKAGEAAIEALDTAEAAIGIDVLGPMVDAWLKAKKYRRKRGTGNGGSEKEAAKARISTILSWLLAQPKKQATAQAFREFFEGSDLGKSYAGLFGQNILKYTDDSKTTVAIGPKGTAFIKDNQVKATTDS